MENMFFYRPSNLIPFIKQPAVRYFRNSNYLCSPKKIVNFFAFRTDMRRTSMGLTSPGLWQVWGDDELRKIKVDTKLRDSDQIDKVNEIMKGVLYGIEDILDHVLDNSEKDKTSVVSTAENSLAIGIPISEHQLSVLLGHIYEYLKKNNTQPLHFHLSNMYVHFSGETGIISAIPGEQNPTFPEVINCSVIGFAGEKSEPVVQLYYKQLVDPTDVFYEHSKLPSSLARLNQEKQNKFLESIDQNRITRFGESHYAVHS